MAKKLVGHREPVLPFRIVWDAIERGLADRQWRPEDLYAIMGERFGSKPDTHRRAIDIAEDSGWIPLHKADRYLVILNLTLYDLEGYTLDYEPPIARNVQGRHIPEDTVREGMRMLERGVTPREVCKVLDVTPRTVQRWRAKLKVPA